MIPSASITGSILDALFVYVAILGILLLAATWLRLKVPFLKTYFIPASLIAGIVGMILGPHFIGLIPADATSCWSALSGRLIVIAFVPMLMGKRSRTGKGLLKQSLACLIWSYHGTFMQYAVPLLLSAFLISPIFGVNDLFGTIVEPGWCGGHGTAGGMGLIYENFGWTEGQSLAVTSATIGLVFGILGGIVLINIGVRRGWTKFLRSSTGLVNNNTELYTDENKPVNSYDSVATSVISSYAFHAGLIGAAAFIGWVLNWLLMTFFQLQIAWFVSSLFGGLIVWKCIEKTSWGDAVDRKTLTNIQGLSLEFLIAGSVASVNVPVVLAYAGPLLIQQVTMMVLMVTLVLLFARHIFQDCWFENGMMLFGTFTGVTATGLLLLKTCDPKMESDASEVFATASPFTAWAIGGGLITSLVPVWVAQHGALNVGLIFLAGSAITFILPRLFGLWHPIRQNNSF